METRHSVAPSFGSIIAPPQPAKPVVGVPPFAGRVKTILDSLHDANVMLNDTSE